MTPPPQRAPAPSSGRSHGLRWGARAACLLTALLLTACAPKPATLPEPEQPYTPGASTFGYVEPAAVSASPTGTRAGGSRSASRQPLIRYGSGELVGAPADGGSPPAASGGDVTLNFESADLQDFVRTIFEDILKENYEIDPNVQGRVTMRTTMPVSREAVLPILESTLQANGAALIRGAGVSPIVPANHVSQSLAVPTVGRSPSEGVAGYGVQIVPLQYVAAAEIKKVLDPFTIEPTKVEIDEARNVVMLSGPRVNVNNLIETIKIFDVDWFTGMSFGLFPAAYADVNRLAEEIYAVLGLDDKGTGSRMVRLIPVERLNALLVVTKQPKHLRLVADLIQHFDQGTQAGPGRRLFVYNLRHAEATDLADTLQDIFGGDSGTSRRRTPLGRVAPGERPVTLSSPAPLTASEQSDFRPSEEPALPLSAADRASDQDGLGTGAGPVSIKADAKSNALLVLASPADYRAVEEAIAKLDVPSRQVLIEATIAEVALTDNMSYGIRWFFETGIGDYRAAVGFNAPPPQQVGGQGLSMAIFNNAGEVRLFFDILGAATNVKFLSAPQVVVVDNQTANFRVGDQIPIVTRASQSTVSPDAPIVTEVEYRDTGTLLTVKPRIDAGGMVNLTISQEVSTPGASAAGSNPPIAQRNINSTVVVQSGQTVVLGGLIRENRLKSRTGVPGLMDMPVLGGLFRSTTDDIARSELIITVTPRVIQNPYEYQQATEDLRKRVQRATSVEQSARR